MCKQSFLRTVLAITALLVVLPLSVAHAKRPNIIFILADDQGWNGLSVQMHPDMPEKSRSDYYQTPNLEELAKAGMRFSDAYAPGPMCSPTRASLQTGKSPAQLGMTDVGGNRSAPTPASQKLILPPNTSTLSTEETTIGEVLQRAGYATAFFGKWHLGREGGPGQHGYDEHDGPTSNGNGDVGGPNPKDIFGISERGMAFMEKNAKGGKPFYLQLWHYAVHGPIHCLEKTQEACGRREPGKHHTNPSYAAMTEDLDTGVGLIMKKIKELGIGDNTYIVYTSDHGAPTNLSTNTPLNRGKGTLWEGGLRVPFIISGPGIKAGVFCGTRTVGWDLFPTFCELAGVTEPLPEGLEGASLKPLFATGKGELKRPSKIEVAFHFPHYKRNDHIRSPHSTILLADYKLLKYYENNQFYLFNLKEDIGEQNNLSKELPDVTRRMHSRLSSYLENINAGLPSPNPDYDPAAVVQAGGRAGGGRGGRAQAGGRGGSKVDPNTGLSPREATLKRLLAIKEAFKQRDHKKTGQLINELVKRLETQPNRPAAKRKKGNRPSPRDERLKVLKELQEEYKQNDMEKVGQLIEKIISNMRNQPAGPAGRGAAGRGRGGFGGADRQGATQK